MFLTKKLFNLAEVISNILIEKNETISVVESSSGGLISAVLLSIPGASQYFVGSATLYSYTIREAIVGLGENEHQKYNGSTPELILDIATLFKRKMKTTWVLGEGGAAGPTKSPYGHNAGYTALAVVGPVMKSRTIETKIQDRVKNMSLFTESALELFIEVSSR